MHAHAERCARRLLPSHVLCEVPAPTASNGRNSLNCYTTLCPDRPCTLVCSATACTVHLLASLFAAVSLQCQRQQAPLTQQQVTTTVPTVTTTVTLVALQEAMQAAAVRHRAQAFSSSSRAPGRRAARAHAASVSTPQQVGGLGNISNQRVVNCYCIDFVSES